jgi:hypothetical protein
MQFTTVELNEALRAISSMISKLEKVQAHPNIGVSQRTLLNRRLKALNIASSLINQTLSNGDD